MDANNKKGSDGKFLGEAVDDAGGFDAYAGDLAYQADDVAGVVFTVGVGVAFDLVLVDDPFERGAGDAGDP